MIVRPTLVERFLLAYCRSPEHWAKQRIVGWLGRNLFPNGGARAKISSGVSLYLHPRDWIELTLLRGLSYEPSTLRFLERNLCAGETALLAGVNFGLHVVVAAIAVGPSGRIIGVEPQPAAVMRARRNLDLNGRMDHVHLIIAALGDSPALISLPPPPTGNAGAASLLDSGVSGYEVSVLPVASLFTALGVPAVRLALLDVQGYELRALAGFRGGPLPELMVVEADEAFLAKAKSSRGQLLDALRGYGYGVFDIHGNGIDATSPLTEQNLVAVAANARVDWVT